MSFVFESSDGQEKKLSTRLFSLTALLQPLSVLPNLYPQKEPGSPQSCTLACDALQSPGLLLPLPSPTVLGVDLLKVPPNPQH